MRIIGCFKKFFEISPHFATKLWYKMIVMDLIGIGSIIEGVGKVAEHFVTTDKEKMALELEGRVGCLPGGLYQRLGRETESD